MFPEVYRAWSGIGSLAQIAGRCSCEETEGRKSSVLFLFEPERIYTLGLHPTMRKSMVLAREITAEFGSPFTAEATRAYFEKLYADRQALDEKKILERLSRTRTLFPFADIAAEVKFVTEETCIVLIPLEKEAQALAGRLLRGERSRALIRLIMRYSVQTSEAHLQVLVAAGAVQLIEERLAVLWATEYYSEMMGLQLEPEPVTGQDPIL